MQYIEDCRTIQCIEDGQTMQYIEDGRIIQYIEDGGVYISQLIKTDYRSGAPEFIPDL
jgi:membrane protease subunit (stomatin/prohibitin family)